MWGVGGVGDYIDIPGFVGGGRGLIIYLLKATYCQVMTSSPRRVEGKP